MERVDEALTDICRAQRQDPAATALDGKHRGLPLSPGAPTATPLETGVAAP